MRFLQRRKAKGRPVPALDRQPTLCFGAEEVWGIFNVLSRTRMSSGYGPQPIQLRELLACCDLFGVQSTAERRDLVRLIQALDAAYLEHEIKRLKAQSSKKR